MKKLVFIVFNMWIIDHLRAEKTRIFLSENKPKNFTQLASKYNLNVKRYDVVTDDGYILGLFHIPGNRGLPTLLMHGVADTSDTWLLRGDKSLGVNLAYMDYDLWFGNVRGNKYSRRHLHLNPDKDSSFWDYSFHEHGFYDLPAIIDTVIAKTGASTINGIGHSQGNTIFYVLGSLKPEYNDKINILIALAPISYLSHIQPPLSTIVKVGPQINTLLESIGVNEIFGEDTLSGKIVDVVCKNSFTGYPICLLGVLFPIFGFDMKELGPKFYNHVVHHFPSATTRKNFHHYTQVSNRRSFARYDYGPDTNFQLYNSTIPPVYDLNRVTMAVVLVAAKNDKISVVADVATLKVQLPNVKNYVIIENDSMNHLDFIWGERMEDYLLPTILYAIHNSTDKI